MLLGAAPAKYFAEKLAAVRRRVNEEVSVVSGGSEVRSISGTSWSYRARGFTDLASQTLRVNFSTMPTPAHETWVSREQQPALPDESSLTRQRVLVFNFFAGVKERGIPLYAKEMGNCLERVGFTSHELACPRVLRRLPSTLLNVVFVGFEQIVAPLVRVLKGCTVTIYPYNSAGVLDALLGRAILVVHDLIPNQRPLARSLASGYVQWTQRVHCSRHRPVCAVSRHTLKMLRRLQPYASCPLYCWPNPFYRFETVARQLANQPIAACKRQILLATGTGSNKDFAGALDLFCASADHHDAELRVFGFGGDANLALRRVRRLPKPIADRVTVLGLLSMDALAKEYRNCNVVWVHSLKEGYGRPVVEARLSGRPALVSNIGAFRTLARLGGVQIYSSSNFAESLNKLLAGGRGRFPAICADALHRELETSVRQVIESCVSAAG